jgi:hypothetical protein
MRACGHEQMGCRSMAALGQTARPWNTSKESAKHMHPELRAFRPAAAMNLTTRRAHARSASRMQVYNYSCCIPNQGPNGEPPGGLTMSSWLFVTPKEFRLALKWISKRYNNPEIKITENGVSGAGEDVKPLPDVLYDHPRQKFYRCVGGGVEDLCGLALHLVGFRSSARPAMEREALTGG